MYVNEGMDEAITMHVEAILVTQWQLDQLLKNETVSAVKYFTRTLYCTVSREGPLRQDSCTLQVLPTMDSSMYVL
jgi:hypothetical protein